MKYFIFAVVFILWAIFLPQGCKEKAKDTIPIVHRDTASTLAIFRSPDKKSMIHDIITRIVIDTLAYFPEDNNTLIKKWGKDTSYRVVIRDTLRMPDGKPKLDSLQKPIIAPFLWIYGKDMIILDCFCNLDSVFRKVKL